MSVEKICWPTEQVIVWIGTFIWLALLCSFLYFFYMDTLATPTQASLRAEPPCVKTSLAERVQSGRVVTSGDVGYAAKLCAQAAALGLSKQP